MEIQVDRFISDSDSTVSRIFVDGQYVCFGLEDEYREEKLANETRIPQGTYPVCLRTEGGFHQRYSRKFPEIHQGMLHIQNVPNFEYILIHIGNTDEDTAGCLLVGEQCITTPGEMRVNQSKSAYLRFYPLVANEAQNNNLIIRYTDNDRR